MIRSLYFQKQGKKATGLTVDEMRAALQDTEGLLWISLEHPTETESTAILRELFHFHPLAIEDCLNSGYQTPKVDDYGSYIFLIAQAIRSSENFAEFDTMELNFFLGANYLVTVFLSEHMRPVDNLWTRLERDERLTQNGSDFLCHGLLDFLVDEYMPVLDHMDDEIESIEDQVLAKPTPPTLARLIELKHNLLFLRRIIAPQREVMNRLSRDDFPMIDRQSRIYFRDIYDHLVRFQDLIESLRDVVSGGMDIYLNSTSLRLNEVMKALTIVSTIFLPLSFLAGVYGMNFGINWPPFDWRYGIVFFWVICIAVAGGMLTFFKRRGWF